MPTSDSITDQYSGRLPRLLEPAVLGALSRPNASIACLRIAAEWVAIFGAIVVCERFWNPLLYGLTIVWIGARQHALGVLMHDAVHFRLTRAKRWNDWLSEPLLAWPIFITTHAYRINHFAHHRHVNTEGDPDLQRKQTKDWVFPKRVLELALLLLRDVTALNTHEHVAMFAELATPRARMADTAAPPQRHPLYVPVRLAYYATIATAVTHFGVWTAFLLYWAIPYLTWMKLVLRLRSIAEHFAIESTHPLNMTRTTVLGPIARWFIAPHNISYHIEHHLYPSTPFFRLPSLHRTLMQQSAYRDAAHVTYGYLAVLRECVRFRGRSLVSLAP